MKEVRYLRFIGRLIKRIIGFAFLLFCIFALLYLVPLTEKSDSNGMAMDAEWMSTVPDDTPLNEITLAGTHASATQFTQFPFLFRCQAMSVEAQLNAGFRFLDIGVAVESEDGGRRLKVMTGFIDCLTGAMPDSDKLYLDGVLTQCFSFLRQHPTETVIFAVSQQHGKESVSSFQQLLNSYVRHDEQYWFLSNKIPTLGECRGKLVLMRSFEDEAGFGAASGISLRWDDQSAADNTALHTVACNNGTYTLFVQDRSGYSDEEKWRAFVSGMAAGSRETSGGAVSLNFLSSNGPLYFGHPYRHAAVLNAALRNRGEKLGGWIIVDFGEPYLARLAYSSRTYSSSAQAVTSPGNTDEVPQIQLP